MKRGLFIILGMLSVVGAKATDLLKVNVADKVLNIALENEEAYCAFRMDIMLPTGIGAVSMDKTNRLGTGGSSAFILDSVMREGNVLRVIGYNMTNQSISGHEGNLFSINLTDIPALAQNISVRNITLIKTNDMSGVAFEDASGSGNIKLADGTVYNGATTSTYSQLTYTRNFKNTNWQPLYVPFSMQYSDWAEEGLEIARLNGFYEYDDDKDGKIDRSALEVLMVTEGEGRLKPNHPYMIRSSSIAEKSIVMNDATLFPAEENTGDCSTFETTYIFKGIYNTLSLEELEGMGGYIMSGGSLKPSASTLSPMRWYMVRESRGGQLLPVLNEIKVFVSGEEDALDFVNAETEEGDTYNLMGQKVSGQQKGIVIRNGKKYVR